MSDSRRPLDDDSRPLDDPSVVTGAHRRRALGRGLGALIPGAGASTGPRTAEIPLNRLTPNPLQPRKSIDPAELSSLVGSVKQHGIVQPIVVRPAYDGFEVVAGERRWRAAEAAGLETIPAVVLFLTDQEALELALVENLQREDLNPMERAGAYRRLLDDFGLTQEQIAERVGKSQPSIANALRLLNLPPQIQAALEAGRITEGHARALLTVDGVPAMVRLWERVERRGLSVRETEQIARRNISREIHARPRLKDPQLRASEQDLARRFATKVLIQGTRSRGNLLFEYYSEEDLQRILDLLLT